MSSTTWQEVIDLRRDFEDVALCMLGPDWREKAATYKKAIQERQERIERGDPCQLTSWYLQGEKVYSCGDTEGHDGPCWWVQ